MLVSCDKGKKFVAEAKQTGEVAETDADFSHDRVLSEVSNLDESFLQ